jgi:hypothetical protein
MERETSAVNCLWCFESRTDQNAFITAEFPTSLLGRNLGAQYAFTDASVPHFVVSEYIHFILSLKSDAPLISGLCAHGFQWQLDRKMYS